MPADTKERFEVSSEIPKIFARHSVYGRAVILAKKAQGYWLSPKVRNRGGQFSTESSACWMPISNSLDEAEYG